MNTDALGPARHIQSATAARLDLGYLGDSEGESPEVGSAKTVDGRTLFAGRSAESEGSNEDRDTGRSGDSSAADEVEEKKDARAEIRRLLEDREEELSLELRLQQSRLENDPTRTIEQLSDLRRDSLADGHPGLFDYKVASEVARERISARLKQTSAEEPRSDAVTFGAGADQPSPVGSGHRPSSTTSS